MEHEDPGIYELEDPREVLFRGFRSRSVEELAEERDLADAEEGVSTEKADISSLEEAGWIVEPLFQKHLSAHSLLSSLESGYRRAMKRARDVENEGARNLPGSPWEDRREVEPKKESSGLLLPDISWVQMFTVGEGRLRHIPKERGLWNQLKVLIGKSPWLPYNKLTQREVGAFWGEWRRIREEIIKLLNHTRKTGEWWIPQLGYRLDFGKTYLSARAIEGPGGEKKWLEFQPWESYVIYMGVGLRGGQRVVARFPYCLGWLPEEAIRARGGRWGDARRALLRYLEGRRKHGKGR